jgi:hypothetical protein
MARSRSTGSQTPSVKSDVYVGLLVISLAAQIMAAVFFYLDWSSYPEAAPRPPSPIAVPSAPPAAGVGGGNPAGPPAGGAPAAGGMPAAGGPPMPGVPMP